MPAIRVLDETTANQIAAGEVVERPASVVKELVENALDAGARRIEVTCTGGGTEEIVVTDDGCGLPGHEVALAFQRHATSKLTHIDDLTRLATLGFRGEALPSIASVAKVTFTSRTTDAREGWRLTIEGGTQTELTAVGAAPGTTVSVSSLFFNTPARRAGLRSTAAELAAIAQIVSALALAHPEVAIALFHEGRPLLQTTGDGKLEHVLLALYGPDFVAGMRPLSLQRDGITISGWVGLPSLAKRSRHWQWLLVNRRPVRHAGVRAAAENAFRGLLPSGKFPAMVIGIHVPPNRLDVNIHPRKLEIKFGDERIVTSSVYRAVLDCVRTWDLTPDVQQVAEAAEVYRVGGASGDVAAASAAAKPVGGQVRSAHRPHAESPGERMGVQDALALMRPGEEVGAERRFPALRALGQVAGTYIVAEGPDGVYLLDQHAAHERIHFERFLKAPRNGAMVQELATPLVVRLDPMLRARRTLVEESLTDLGFEAVPFGADTLLLRAVPEPFVRDTQSKVERFLALLADEEAVPPEDAAAMRTAWSRAACRAAVKANDRLSLPELQALLDQLSLLDEPYTCPHGRPTVFKVTVSQLERYFGR